MPTRDEIREAARRLIDPEYGGDDDDFMNDVALCARVALEAMEAEAQCINCSKDGCGAHWGPRYLSGARNHRHSVGGELVRFEFFDCIRRPTGDGKVGE